MSTINGILDQVETIIAALTPESLGGYPFQVHVGQEDIENPVRDRDFTVDTLMDFQEPLVFGDGTTLEVKQTMRVRVGYLGRGHHRETVRRINEDDEDIRKELIKAVNGLESVTGFCNLVHQGATIRDAIGGSNKLVLEQFYELHFQPTAA